MTTHCALRLLAFSIIKIAFLLFLGTPAFASGPQMETRNFGPFHFYFDKKEEKLVVYLGGLYKKIENRITEDLGLLDLEEIQVIIVSTQKAFISHQPSEKKAQKWAAALAYPAQGKILMKSPKLLLGGQPNYEKIFIHEVAHIALHRALNQRKQDKDPIDSPSYSEKLSIPLWLHEGYAIYIAREWSPNREVLLTQAILRNKIIPLGRLVSAFPTEESLARLAYAESADLVHFLINSFGRESFQRFIAILGKGYRFGHACRHTYGLDLFELEKKWIKHLKRRYTWVTLLGSTGTLWFLTSLIFLASYIYKKITTRATLARWEEEESD